MIASIFTLLMLHFLVKWSLNLILGINIGDLSTEYLFSSRVESGASEQLATVQGVRNCYTPPHPVLRSWSLVTTTIPLPPLFISPPFSPFRQNMIHSPSVPLVFSSRTSRRGGCPGEVSKWTRVACWRVRAQVRACVFALLCTLQIAHTSGTPPERGSFLDPHGTLCTSHLD